MSAEESDRDLLNQALTRLAFLERCHGVTDARLLALEAHHTDDIPPFIRAAVPEDALPSGERTTQRRGLPPDFLKPGGIQWVDDVDVKMRDERNRAIRSLEAYGFTDSGGEFWKPPLGKNPLPLADLAHTLRTAHRLMVRAEQYRDTCANQLKDAHARLAAAGQAVTEATDALLMAAGLPSDRQ